MTVILNRLDFFLPWKGKKNPILARFSLAFVEKVSVWHFGSIVFTSLECGWHPTSMFYAEGPGRGPNLPITMRLTSSHRTEASATKPSTFPFHAIYILWSCLNYVGGKLTLSYMPYPMVGTTAFPHGGTLSGIYCCNKGMAIMWILMFPKHDQCLCCRSSINRSVSGKREKTLRLERGIPRRDFLSNVNCLKRW